MALGIMTAALCFSEMLRPVPVSAQPAPGAVASASPSQGVRARGTLRACIWPEAYAFSWRNPRSDQLEGLGITLSQGLARRLGLPLRLIETNVADFPARLERGECDVAAIGVGMTPARGARVAYSRPFLSSPIFAVVPRDSWRLRDWADLDRVGVVIAVNGGSAMERVMRDRLRDAQLLVLYPPEQREQEVLAGRADAFMSDYPFMLRMQRTRDWAQVLEPPMRFDVTLYALAVPRGDPAWLAEVDAYLAEARDDGSLARAAEEAGLGAMLLR
jgi:ABC-type amino acid transport substrate-binding protein